MEAKQFDMTEIELQEYCDSLSERDLKKFQLESKQAEINLWKYKLHFTIANLLVVALVMFLVGNIILIACGIISLGLIAYIIRCYNYMKSEQLLYRILVGFFEQNNI